METKPLSLRRTLSLVCALVLLVTTLVVPVSAAPPKPGKTVHKFSVTGTADYKTAFEVLELVNAERKKLGRPALVMDKTTMEAAMQRAAECAIDYSHTRPDGSGSQTVLNWEYSFGENIAAGFTNAKAVMQGWMASSGHKANILDDHYYVTHRSHHRYTSIGIGVFKVGDTYYWSQLFNGAEKKANPTEKKAVTKTFTVEALASYLDLSISQKKLSLQGKESVSIAVTNKNIMFYQTAATLTAKGLRYTSSNTAVATVSASGKVTGVGAGEAKITVKCQNGNTLFTVPVTVKSDILDATISTVSNGIKVSWGKVSSATSYKVYKRLYSDGKWQKASLYKTTTALSFTDTSVKSGQLVKYIVYGYKGKKELPSHDSVSTRYLAQPKVTVANTATTVKVSWDKVTGASYYKVYRSEYKNGKWGSYSLCKSTKTTSYSHTGVKSGQQWRYMVYAVYGTYMSAEKAGVAITYLARPSVKIANAANGVKLSWSKIAGASYYKVYKSTYSGGKWSSYSYYKSTTAASYTDTKVTSGQKVRYIVYAVSGSYKSAKTSSVSTLYLAQPKVKLAKATKGVKVSWGKITGASYYKVYKSTYSGGKWSSFTLYKSTKSLSYNDTSVKSKQKVRYIVYAVYGSNTSYESAIVSITR